MSLRKLPKIEAFEPLEALAFEPDPDALEKWSPNIHAAVEGDAAVISIYDQIGEGLGGEGATSRRIAAALRQIGPKEVTVNINSPGGNFFEGVAIYNLLREHPAAVTVKVMGLAASAASVIAMAGDRIEVPEVGFLMVHNAQAVAVGNRHDLRQAADTMGPFDDAMAGLYASRAGVERSVAAGWMDAETWFNGAKAVELGLADEIMEPDAIAEGPDAPSNSLRQVDTALAKAGMPRSERRTLLADIRGTQDAASHATQDAGDDAAALLRKAIDTLT